MTIFDSLYVHHVNENTMSFFNKRSLAAIMSRFNAQAFRVVEYICSLENSFICVLLLFFKKKRFFDKERKKP